MHGGMTCREHQRLALQYLGVVHETSAEAFDLLIGSDCTEGNLAKVLLVEGSICDAAHHISFPPDDGHRAMPAIQHQAGNVLSWHVGQLLRKDILQSNQPVQHQQCSMLGSRKLRFEGISLCNSNNAACLAAALTLPVKAVSLRSISNATARCELLRSSCVCPKAAHSCTYSQQPTRQYPDAVTPAVQIVVRDLSNA